MSILISNYLTGEDYGNVKLSINNRILLFSSKSTSKNSYTNCGIYSLNIDLIKKIKPQKKLSLESDLIPHWIPRYKIYGFKHSNYFYDIGTKDRYSSYLNMYKE